MLRKASELFLALLSLVLMPLSASALDFRSVAVPKAILYDAPSLVAKKIFLLSQYYPVEVVVNLTDWVKVRDAQGAISWVEAKQLSTKRTVLVNANSAELKQAPDASSSLLATLKKNLVLEVVDTPLNGGWIKVKHRDGTSGFVLISSVWGAN
jgi:SH3-like domain-containing protein